MFKRFRLAPALLLLVPLLAMPVDAFQQGGCGDGQCRTCHQLSKKDAATLLSVEEKRIINLKTAEVPGLWQVDVRQRKNVIPVFIDFSKQYLISGSIIKIADKKDITREQFVNLNLVNVSQIPLHDALVVGNPIAKTKIIVFDDPQCPYCAKLQEEMKRVVDHRPDIAFFIKMFPLKSHSEAYTRAKAIVCANSMTMLEKSLAGKPLDAPACETDQIEKNMNLANRIGIRSTPTLVFPDGRVIPGYKPWETIIRLLEITYPERKKDT